MKTDKLKLTKKGHPVKPSMKHAVMPNACKEPEKVRDHPLWKHEAKPWGEPCYPRKSQHSSTEAHYLYRIVKELGVGNYANLGVYKGGSVNSIAQGLKELGGGKVYAVDLFDLVNGAEYVETLVDLFKERGTDKYTEFCRGYTHEVAPTLDHLKFKFIFIDADHAYETCRQDFELWSPLLEPDGLISFHDTNFNTVDKVINDCLGDWELVDHVWKIKSFRKKR